MGAFPKDIPIDKSAILIVLTGSLGDVTRALCLIKPLKTFWPHRPLVWLVEARWAGLVKLNPEIDHLVIFNRSAKPQALRALKHELRSWHFHTSLDLQRIFKSGFLTYLGGAGLKLGFNRKNAKEFNWLFNNRHIPYYPETLPKIEHYRKFLDYLNVPYSAEPDFGLDSGLLAKLLPPTVAGLHSPYAVLAAGSSWPSKDWHAAGYRELAAYLFSACGLHSVITGDKTQIGLARTVTQGHTGHIIDLTGKTDLPQLAAVLKGAKLAIGPDSGAGHIAVAVKTPYIALFGPTAPRRTAPYGYEKLVVQLNMSCGPCYKKNCPDNQCMQKIGLAEIKPKIDLALTL